MVDTGSSVTLLNEKVWKVAVHGQKQLNPANLCVVKGGGSMVGCTALLYVTGHKNVCWELIS